MSIRSEVEAREARELFHETMRVGVSVDQNYEHEAIKAIQRSWDPDMSNECRALALADAQVYATLHLARVINGGEIH